MVNKLHLLHFESQLLRALAWLQFKYLTFIEPLKLTQSLQFVFIELYLEVFSSDKSGEREWVQIIENISETYKYSNQKVSEKYSQNILRTYIKTLKLLTSSTVLRRRRGFCCTHPDRGYSDSNSTWWMNLEQGFIYWQYTQTWAWNFFQGRGWTSFFL